MHLYFCFTETKRIKICECPVYWFVHPTVYHYMRFFSTEVGLERKNEKILMMKCILITVKVRGLQTGIQAAIS